MPKFFIVWASQQGKRRFNRRFYRENKVSVKDALKREETAREANVDLQFRQNIFKVTSWHYEGFKFEKAF